VLSVTIFSTHSNSSSGVSQILKQCNPLFLTSTILYGSECWTLKGQHERKVGVVEMRVLRWMHDHTRNEGYEMIIYNKDWCSND